MTWASSDTRATVLGPGDVERNPTGSRGTIYDDPLSFNKSRKSEDELSALRKRSRTGRRIADYQRRQNDLIDSLLMPMEAHSEQARQAEEANRLPVRIAIYASLGSNIVLSGLQLYAAITSGSLSFLATAIDSVFDPASNFVLDWLHRKSEKLDLNKWPVGGSRLETTGNIVYGERLVHVMAAVNLVVVTEAARTIITHKGDDLNDFYLPSVIAVSVALGVKIMLFLYCFTIRQHSSQVQVLWEDHRNDLFVNGFGLLMSSGGSKWAWYLDPMGGLIIALGTMASWARTIYHEFELLTGKSAEPDFLHLVTYKAMTYTSDIISVDTVRAYHSGPNIIVEVDIVMDEQLSLRHTHDVSQMLQDKLETLPGVERAYVHVDYESTHTPEHRKKE
ncbi:cation efflux family-domain-containing protein [Schizophyllum amplum]|uniref:Cation efflux family-domain-containing protein n=1 Tax=Schizophyllum amplum TaxID=97359 RepID=A0A550CE13_9AGAR|nr:cation efflux family-domain-containing protein [Auriculariopsis ampla]